MYMEVSGIHFKEVLITGYILVTLTSLHSQPTCHFNFLINLYSIVTCGSLFCTTYLNFKAI